MAKGASISIQLKSFIIAAVLFLLSINHTSMVSAADSAFQEQVQKIQTGLQRNNLNQAKKDLDKFWRKNKKDEGFLEAVRQIKDAYWSEDERAAHYALCDRITKEFAGHTLAVATSADVVRGYIYDGDMDTAAVKLEEFWRYGHSDENFLEYARQIKDLYWEKKEYEAHYALCDRIVKDFPKHPLAISTLGDVIRGYVYNSDLENAAKKLKTFIGKRSDSTVYRETMHAVGQAYRWEGKDPATGREIYNQWLKKYSNDPKAYLIQAAVVKTYLEEDDVDGANQALGRFKQLCNSKEDVYHEMIDLADTYKQKEHPEKSLELYHWFVDEFPKHEQVCNLYVLQMGLYLKDNDQENADIALDNLMSMSSNGEIYREAIHVAGSTYRWEVGNPARGREIYNRWLELYSDDPKSYVIQEAIVKSYLEEDDFDGANAALVRYEQLCSGREDVYGETAHLIDIYKQKNQIGSSIELARWFMEQYPDNDNVDRLHLDMIKGYIQLGDESRADVETGKLLKKADSPDVIKELADYFRESYEYDRAESLYKSILGKWPKQKDNIWVRFGLEIVQSELGSDSEAPMIDLAAFRTDFADDEELSMAVFEIGFAYYYKAFGANQRQTPERKSELINNAIAIWEEVIEDGSISDYEKVRGYYALGDCYRKQCQYSKSNRSFEKVLADFNDEKLTRNSLLSISKNFESMEDKGFSPSRAKVNLSDPNNVYSVSEADEITSIDSKSKAFEVLLNKYPDSKEAAYVRRSLGSLKK